MRLGAEQPYPMSLQAPSSTCVCAGSTDPEGLLSDPPTPPLETVQEVRMDSISEEAPPISISDDPDIAWDLMASGFLILTGQWASVIEGKGVKEREAVGVGCRGRQGGCDVLPQPGQPCHFVSSGGVDQSGRALLTITPPCSPEEPSPSQDMLSSAFHYLHSLLR